MTKNDMPKNHWIDRLPSPWCHYLKLMRLDRPIGAWLCLYPALWGILFGVASINMYHIKIAVLFTIGAFIMRGAGCVINDIADIEFDKKVERTATRPLASGALKIKHAIYLLCILLATALCILLYLPLNAIIIGAIAIIPISLYPFAKRFTFWPQAILGIAFNWGVFIGWFTVRDSFSIELMFLFFACFFWTLGYDTIYAHQDKDDDVKIGVKSSALFLGNKYTKPFLLIDYGLCSICFYLAGYFAQMSLVYFATLSLGIIHFIYQIIILDTNNAKLCLKLFKSAKYTGAIILVGGIIARLYA